MKTSNRVPETRVYQVMNRDPHDRLRFDQCHPVLIDRTKIYSPVLTKQDFYRRFYEGEFGNHGPMWKTVRDFLQSGHPGPIAIRCMRRGGRCDYFVPRDEVLARTRSFVNQGYPELELNFSAMAPDDRSTLKGEVAYRETGVHLLGTYARLPMRMALAEKSFYQQGLTATMTLKRAMDRGSYEWIQKLINRYPDHVIEFTSYEFPWGVLPGMNTVIWEVRKY